MKILFAAPQSTDTILGTIAGYCQNALKNFSHDITNFDFRQSRYLKSHAGLVIKKYVKRIFPDVNRQIPFARSLERGKMNRCLLKAAEEEKPDVLFVLMGETILPETLCKIRKLGIITVNWFHDSVLHPMRRDFVQTVSPYYDYFFMIDSENVLNYIKISSRCLKTLPLACAPEVHKNMDLSDEEKQRYGSDICFIGTVKFKRGEILRYLADLDMGIWGYWSEVIPALKNCYRKQYVFGRESIKIYNASKIALDIHPSYGTGDKLFNVTPRVFEVPASGTFLLTNENPLLADLYKVGEEIVCYKDEKDLKDKIKYYLAHPEERKAIALKGQQRAYCDHTYQKRLERIISIIEKNG